jgi:hypothetical protein
LLRPEPGPVGVIVEPLGEPLGASVFPDGFMVVLEPPLAPLVRPTVEPGGLLIEFPVADEPVLGATELPAPEVPPAVPPPLLCASANVLESASAPANATVMSFMVVSFVMTGRKPRQTADVPWQHEDVSIAPAAGLTGNQRSSQEQRSRRAMLPVDETSRRAGNA